MVILDDTSELPPLTPQQRKAILAWHEGLRAEMEARQAAGDKSIDETAQPPHEPGSFTMVFSDQMGGMRTSALMTDFVARLRKAAGPAGFDIHSWGTTSAVLEAYQSEE